MRPELPPQYFEVFDLLLRNLLSAAYAPDLPDLVAFPTQVGKAYRSGAGLLVIGRAPNGWDNRFTIESLKRNGPSAIIDSVRRASLVNTEWTRQRASVASFLRVTREIVCRLYSVEPSSDWPDHICWTNLAKIAPADSGNPSERLWQAQLANCCELLRIEVDALKPARVLVLAGRGWYGPFLPALGIECNLNEEELVEGVASRGDQVWVLAKHPQRKPERPLIDAAVAAFLGRVNRRNEVVA